MAKQESKPKPSKFSQLTFATEVGRFVSERRPAMDFWEEKIATEAATLELLTKGEQLGINRATMFRWILSERALRTSDELVVAVFEACGLDLMRPLHWTVLFGALIEAGFARSSGRPIDWDEARYYDLFCDINELSELDPALKSDEAIAEGLRNRRSFGDKYNKWKVGYLRKKVAEVKQMFEGVPLGASFEQFVAESRAKRFGWSSEFLQEFIEKMRSQIVDEMGFDPDKASAILDEAEKQAAHKRRQQLEDLMHSKKTD